MIGLSQIGVGFLAFGISLLGAAAASFVVGSVVPDEEASGRVRNANRLRPYLVRSGGVLASVGAVVVTVLTVTGKFMIETH